MSICFTAPVIDSFVDFPDFADDLRRVWTIFVSLSRKVTLSVDFFEFSRFLPRII